MKIIMLIALYSKSIKKYHNEMKYILVSSNSQKIWIVIKSMKHVRTITGTEIDKTKFGNTLK